MSASEEADRHGHGGRAGGAGKLADDVVVIDVSGQLVITDCFVIASASNERQVNAIVDEVEEKMRARGAQAGPPRRRRVRVAGRCSTTSTSSCTSSTRTSATSMRWIGCGATARSSPVDLDWPTIVRVRRLVMLRHGQTEYNAGSRMQGQLDTDLSDLGREQAVAAAEVLAKRQPLLIVSSDLRRALDTAVSLGERVGNAGAGRHPAAGDPSR